MIKMAKCSFCRKDIVQGTGKIYVKIDGIPINFCSGKCEKNMLKLNRNPANLKWTETYKARKETKKKEK